MGVRTLVLLSSLVALAGCRTIDLGDNFVSPEVMLDEDFFYCRVQPEVVSAQSCASGAAGEGGECHSSRSALRLDPMAESVAPPACDAEDMLVGPPPAPYQTNLEALRRAVQSDPLASPIYRRPLALDSHPRQIFDASSPEADLIVEWILMGGT